MPTDRRIRCRRGNGRVAPRLLRHRVLTSLPMLWYPYDSMAIYRVTASQRRSRPRGCARARTRVTPAGQSVTNLLAGSDGSGQSHQRDN